VNLLSGFIHGKGACDGVGGTVKRLAAKASLQRPYDEQTMTPRQQYERRKNFLEEIFQKTRVIPGTHKLHSFIPMRTFSSSTSYKDVKISLLEKELNLASLPVVMRISGG
jgi:hypothetical protein